MTQTLVMHLGFLFDIDQNGNLRTPNKIEILILKFSFHFKSINNMSRKFNFVLEFTTRGIFFNKAHWERTFAKMHGKYCH